MFELGDLSETRLTRDPHVLGLVLKYSNVFHVEPPSVSMKDNLGSKWLGRTIWSPRTPRTTHMQLQKSILDDQKTLERVIAHEIVHHVEFLSMSENNLARIRLGFRPTAHGQRFFELAKIVNDLVEDPEFITETSDQSYVQKETKEYWLLIVKVPDRYGYAISIKMSENMKKKANQILDRYEARILRTSDPRWSSGARIGSGFKAPVLKEDQEKLAQLFEGAANAF
jgi:hypothetical protein